MMIDDDIQTARLQGLEHSRIDPRGGVGRSHAQMQVVVVLGGEDQVQPGREVRRSDRRADRIDIGQGVSCGQAVPIAGLEGDEFRRLPGDDTPPGAYGGGEDAGEIATADDHVGDLLARPDPGEGQGLGGMTPGIPGPIVSGPDRGRKDLGIVGRGERRRGTHAAHTARGRQAHHRHSGQNQGTAHDGFSHGAARALSVQTRPNGGRRQPGLRNR